MLSDIALRTLHALPPEWAHSMSICTMKAGLGRYIAAPSVDYPVLKQSLWGMEFSNPLGMAAGYDKDCEVIAPLWQWGFGFVEAGSVLPHPQPGNPTPRLFRLRKNQAIINSMGFNSKGTDHALKQLQRLPKENRQERLGINLGINKDSTDRVADYCLGIRAFAPHADYLVINVSSPNTEGLRNLQEKDALMTLLSAARAEVNAQNSPPPLLVKIAPDMTDEAICTSAVLCLEMGIDGIIATNTTVARPSSLRGPHSTRGGGLSGRPLFEPATRVLSSLYIHTEGRIPLIGVGGIENAETAWAKITAGASLLELYTAFIWQGPKVIRHILDGLALRVKENGLNTITEAVGLNHKAS